MIGSEGNLVYNSNYSKRRGSSRKRFKARESRQRHNSWHNLVQLDPERADDNMMSFLNKQENYIQQLEKENEFCRHQVAGVLSLMKGDESGTNIIAQMNALKQENEQLRSGPGPSSRKLIDGLRQDNEMLTQALDQSRKEAEDLGRKEAEAVEQVRRSVEVAEQLRLERTDLEYEIGQLKMQVDRMQVRIHAMVEEQGQAVEKERVIIEKHFQSQAEHLKEEMDKQAAELGRLSAELDQRQRVEQDLLRQLQEKDKSIASLSSENGHQMSVLRNELLEALKTRQKLELDLNGLRIEGENARQVQLSETKQLEEENRSLKSRLATTQDALASNRQECLNLAECKAALERQVNHLKMRGPLDEFPTRDTDVKMEEGLKLNMYEMAERQNQIIQELKGQCTVATDKIESLVRQFTKEKEQYEYSLAVLAKQNGAVDRCPNCNGHLVSNQPNSQVYEKLCKRLDNLQNEKLEANERIKQLKEENLRLQKVPSKAITIVKSDRPRMAQRR